jgi:hypothetical protein
MTTMTTPPGAGILGVGLVRMGREGPSSLRTDMIFGKDRRRTCMVIIPGFSTD